MGKKTSKQLQSQHQPHFPDRFALGRQRPFTGVSETEIEKGEWGKGTERAGGKAKEDWGRGGFDIIYRSKYSILDTVLTN